MDDRSLPRCPHCEGVLLEKDRKQDVRRLGEWDAVEWIDYRCVRCLRAWRDDLRRCETVLIPDKRGSKR